MNLTCQNRIGYLSLILLAIASTAVRADVIYNQAFTGTADTLPTGWVSYNGGNQVGLDGNGEFQMKKTSGSTNTTSIAYYADTGVITGGAWRDTTITSKTRFSGDGPNQNGVIFRATDITANTGTGDYYMTRIKDSNKLQLYRFVGGSASQLGSDLTLSGFSPTGGDNHYKITTKNIFDGSGNEGVQITVGMYSNAALTTQIGTDLVYNDFSSNAILSPGGAGYRQYYSSSATGYRAVFDDLIVDSDKPLLQWSADLNVIPGTYQFDITGLEPGVDYAQLDVDGTLTIDPAAELQLDFDPAATFAEGDILWMIDNDGSDPISGQFGNLLDGESYLFSNNTLKGLISYSANFNLGEMTGGNDVALMFVALPVPEPATWILGLVAMMGMIWFRRRRG